MNFRHSARRARHFAALRFPFQRVISDALAALDTVLLAMLLLESASVCVAGQTPKGEIECTRQGLLIVNFTPLWDADINSANARPTQYRRALKSL